MYRKRTRRTSLGPAVRTSRRPTARAETSSLDLLAEKIATAAPKPKNRYWEFFNSSFVLWILTAVLITLTGAYFSTVQRCYSEGEAVSESYAHLSREMFNRRKHMAKAVEKAASIQAIREAATPIQNSKDGRASRCPASTIVCASALTALQQQISIWE